VESQCDTAAVRANMWSLSVVQQPSGLTCGVSVWYSRIYLGGGVIMANLYSLEHLHVNHC